jgi:hypothetical protein
VRPFRLLIVVAAAFALLATPGLAGASRAKATKCTPPKTFPEVGGKFTSLTATGATCKTATSVATAWAKCAAANGKAGRCVTKVAGGYACGESARTIGTTRTSSVVCGKGDARVKIGVTRVV